MAKFAPQLEITQPQELNIVEAQTLAQAKPETINDLLSQPETVIVPEETQPQTIEDVIKQSEDFYQTQDQLVAPIADTSLPPEAMPLLDYIAKYESRGDYNIIVGEGKDIPGTPARFEDYTDHPRIIGKRTINGPSTAAGRYQIVARTWDDIKKKVPGLTDFSPANQDKAAWFLAQRDYRLRTGNDLLTDLREGKYGLVRSQLKDTWTGLKKAGEYAPETPRVVPKNTEEGMYPTIKYNVAGKKRQLPLTPTLEAKLDKAASDLFDGKYSFLVYSGGQKSNKPGEGTGSVRHNDGKAGDVYLVGPDNKVVTNTAILDRVKKYWRDNKFGSVGAYMEGGGMHLDEWTEETLLPGMGLTWDYN